MGSTISTEVLDMQAIAYERMMAQREKYYQPILRLFGYFLMARDEDGFLPHDWEEKVPGIASFSGFEQEIIHDGAVALLYQYDLPQDGLQAIEGWFAEGAPI